MKRLLWRIAAAALWHLNSLLDPLDRWLFRASLACHRHAEKGRDECPF